MNKKALYSILSVVVAMIVLSVSLVFAIGPHVSAMSDENRILVLSSRDDFNWDFHPWIYTRYEEYDGDVCFGISSSLLGEYFGYEFENCEEVWFGTSNKMDKYDEIHILIPEGVTVICDYFLYILPMEILDRITFIHIPDSVVYIGGHAFDSCPNLSSIIIPKGVTTIGNDTFQGCGKLKTVYCECSKEYANEHWSSNWKDRCSAQVVWNCNKTVSFNTQDGSAVENQIVCVDSLVTTPAVPTKDGYAFKGWYTDAECTDAYDFETAVTDDMTLYAKWEEIQTQPEPETSTKENTEVNNQNNSGLIWGIAGASAGILIIAGIVVGIVVTKRRRK